MRHNFQRVQGFGSGDRFMPKHRWRNVRRYQ